MFIQRWAAWGVVPLKSYVPDSAARFQFIQSSVTYIESFTIHLYIGMTYPRFKLKLVPRSHFPKFLPTAPAQCLLVVVVRGREDEGCMSSSR